MSPDDNVSRILAFHTGGIGDLILAGPAVAALRARFPAAHLTGVGYLERLELFRVSGLLDECVSIDSHGFFHLFSTRRSLPQQLIDYLRGTDLVVSWISDTEGNFPCNLRWTGVPKVIVGQALPPHGNEVHAVDNYLGCLRKLGIPTERGIRPELSLPEEWQRRAAQELDALSGGRPFVGMLPGSGSLRKNWPKERFLDLARLLVRKTSAFVVVLLGPAERERGDEDFWRRKENDRMTLMIERPLVELASLLSEMDLFIGCDSGLSHLAAAAGTPVVALFGPTEPAIWAPRGPDGRIVVGDDNSMEGIAPDTVLDAAAAALEKRASRPSRARPKTP